MLVELLSKNFIDDEDEGDEAEEALCDNGPWW